MRYRLLLMLVLLSLAAGIHAQNIPSGVVINKTVTADATVPFKYNVTTEAYVTGEAKSETQDVVTPSDVVILIDNGNGPSSYSYDFDDAKIYINQIIDMVYDNSTQKGVAHRIGLVVCNANTEEDDGCRQLLSFLETNSTNINTLKQTVINLNREDSYSSAESFTNAGLKGTSNLFKNSNSGAKKIIVIVQFGRFYDNEYDEVENTANSLKNDGVDIYSILFYNQSKERANVEKCLGNISNAWTHITKSTDQISFTIDFTKAQNVKSDKPDYTLWTSTSTLKESFSTSLTLNNQTVNVQPAEASNLVTAQNEFISITGLDLSSKYWGTHWINGTATSSGQKLQLTYPLYFDASKSTVAAIPTSSSSGLYEGDLPLFTYSSPSITIPTLVISRTGLNVGESATFTVYKVIGDNETAVGQVVTTCTSKDAAATATLKVPETGTYRVRETTWGYLSSNSVPVTKDCNTSGTFTFTFTGSTKANDEFHAETKATITLDSNK